MRSADGMRARSADWGGAWSANERRVAVARQLALYEAARASARVGGRPWR
jgi:hypothetical protein